MSDNITSVAFRRRCSVDRRPGQLEAASRVAGSPRRPADWRPRVHAGRRRSESLVS